MFARYYWVVEITLNGKHSSKTSCDYQGTCYSIFLQYFFYFYHKIQVILKKQGDHTKANTSGEEAQKETMGLIDIGLPQSKK